MWRRSQIQKHSRKVAKMISLWVDITLMCIINTTLCTLVLCNILTQCIRMTYLIIRLGLFVWDLSSYSRIFHWQEDVIITSSKGLQILAYTRHSWPLSNEDSLACHTNWDTGHPFIIIIIIRDTHSYCCAFSSGAVNTCF